MHLTSKQAYFALNLNKVTWKMRDQFLIQALRAVFYKKKKNHPGHGDQGWTNLSKLGPYTSNDEPLFMAMKISASVAPVFLDEICRISLI